MSAVTAPPPEPNCDRSHCDEAGAAGLCPVSEEYWHIDEIAERMQTAFAKHGPEHERMCDWRRCVEEPWKSLADALEAGR